MILAFEDEKERYKAMKDLEAAIEGFFDKPVSDDNLRIADGFWCRWRQRNRTGFFYEPTGVQKAEKAA